MSFNKGYELKKFEAHWEKLRIEYAAAGMTKEAIQKMYDYDRQQFNSERTFIERTQEFTAPAYARPLIILIRELPGTFLRIRQFPFFTYPNLFFTRISTLIHIGGHFYG